MNDIDLLDSLNNLTRYHCEKADLYRWYIESIFPDYSHAKSFKDLPWVPVRAFKRFVLKSISDDEIYKTLLSSGTSGHQSKIFLDANNAKAQQALLVESFCQFFGKRRYPTLVLDSLTTINDRKKFSARTAGINGFSIFSQGREFAFDSDYQIDAKAVDKFLELNGGRRIMIFGFTYFIWEYFLSQMIKKNIKFDFSNCFLIHGGGWKKLEAMNIPKERFKSEFFRLTSCSEIRNYFGMVEQTGSIFIECAEGRLHAPNGSHAIARSKDNLEIVADGERGLLQFFSNIQTSYPDHSLLTEDVGIVHGKINCPCGADGTVVDIIGRVAKSEVRGCSDAIDR